MYSVPLRGVGDDLRQVGDRVAAAVRGTVEPLIPGQPDRALLAPRSDLGEQGIPLDRETPALVVGEVQVQDVELVQGGQVDQLEYPCLREEVPGHFSELGHFSAGHASRQARMQPPMSSAVAA